jgi:hypothetical protein
MRIFIGIVVLLIILVVGFNAVVKSGKKNHEALVEEKKAYENRVRLPNQAQLYPGDLVKLVEEDMTHNTPRQYTFYYKLEPHTIGLGLYNKKYVFIVDKNAFATYSDVMGHATISNSRFAGVSSKLTITEVVDQTTNQKLKIDDIEGFKGHIVEDTSVHYNDQVEYKEEN